MKLIKEGFYDLLGFILLLISNLTHMTDARVWPQIFLDPDSLRPSFYLYFANFKMDKIEASLNKKIMMNVLVPICC